MALTIGNMMINNVVSFLPTFIENKQWVSETGYVLNANDTALILAMFSIAQIIFAPINGAIKNYIGAKNTIVVGFTLMTVTTAGLGVIAHINNPYAFKYTACLLRFFQGQGDVLLQITGYSIITSIYSSNMMKYIGYIEICVGVGLGMGPVFGSVFFKFLAYEGTMYLFALCNGLATLCCYFFIPKALN